MNIARGKLRKTSQGAAAFFFLAIAFVLVLVVSSSVLTDSAISLSHDEPAIVITARSASAIHSTGRQSGSSFPTGKDPYYVLAIGNDDRPGVEGARADAIHLIGVNPSQNKVTIINFPRDTTVSIPGHGRNKINAANAFGGSALTAQTLEALTGVKISYVLEANFAAFTGLIDDLGGVDVTVEKPMHDHYSGSNFEPGVVHMSGDQALRFSRDRHTFSNGDLQRSQNQAYVLIAALAEMKKSKQSVSSRFESAAIIAKHLKLTNLSLRDLYFLMEQASNIDPANITNILVPWAGSNTLAPKATDLFNDFKDNAVLDTYQ